MNRIKAYDNGHASIERLSPSGMWLVQVYKGSELHDKVRCDDDRSALEYFRAFSAIAKNA